ncbi:hypothetical protein OH460_07640 [Vibrio sp. Makdt]|uniref:hypothetical protein n=1 Tax=Vibrio sp. Makdt TaxID=2998828 RepID=UPI0022CD3133|nr:hypothetical protein [Vibrio sp. Makdt]MDA0152168.1 hypothetical protein [Vibrio sp. Makdt]
MKKQLQCILVVCIGLTGFRSVDREYAFMTDAIIEAGTVIPVEVGLQFAITPRILLGKVPTNCMISYTARYSGNSDRMMIEPDILQCSGESKKLYGYIIDNDDGRGIKVVPGFNNETLYENRKFKLVVTKSLSLSGVVINYETQS